MTMTTMTFAMRMRVRRIVMAAGVIWIGVGSLSLISAMANLALQGVNQQALQGANQQVGGAPGVKVRKVSDGGVCCSGLIGIAFLVCGYQTVTGKSSDTLGNGIGSLVLGLLALLVAAGAAFGGFALLGNQNAPGQGLAVGMMVIAGLVGLWGATLLLAGILALAGRSAYREWRLAFAPRPRRRRRRRREDDDDDD
jgi:hypothetical protein